MTTELRKKLLQAQRNGIFTLEEINAIEDCIVFHAKHLIPQTYTELTISRLLKEVKQ